MKKFITQQQQQQLHNNHPDQPSTTTQTTTTTTAAAEFLNCLNDNPNRLIDFLNNHRLDEMGNKVIQQNMSSIANGTPSSLLAVDQAGSAGLNANSMLNTIGLSNGSSNNANQLSPSSNKLHSQENVSPSCLNKQQQQQTQVVTSPTCASSNRTSLTNLQNYCSIKRTLSSGKLSATDIENMDQQKHQVKAVKSSQSTCSSEPSSSCESESNEREKACRELEELVDLNDYEKKMNDDEIGCTSSSSSSSSSSSCFSSGCSSNLKSSGDKTSDEKTKNNESDPESPFKPNLKPSILLGLTANATSDMSMSSSSSSKSSSPFKSPSSSPLDQTASASSLRYRFIESSKSTSAVSRAHLLIEEVAAAAAANPASRRCQEKSSQENNGNGNSVDSLAVSSSSSGIAYNNNNSKFLSDCSIPPRLEYLLDMPHCSFATQILHSWNPDDRSLNIFVKEVDPLTLHRHPVAQSTDCIRTKMGYTKGIHLWELNWNSRQRGTHAIIGVASDKTALHCVGYQSLIGSNAESWGWDLGRNRACHNTKASNQPPPVYPKMLKPDETFVVPDTFQMCLDMDEGTLSFLADGQYLGVAFRGLKGKKVFPIVSAVWGHCEITMKYINGLDPNPLPLADMCRRCIRQKIGKHRLNEINKLELPNLIKNYLLFK